MSDRPIIFSAPMVRALLDGRKTQTRRILKPQPYPFTCEGRAYWNASGCVGGRISISDAELLRLHRYVVGDRLWVREAWRAPIMNDDVAPRDLSTGMARVFEADGVEMVGAGADVGLSPIGAAGKLRPSIFMPRWATRLTLVVTEVRVERLQDISEANAEAEGVEPIHDHGVGNQHLHGIAFEQLWERLHGPGSWLANPWVAAISFTVHRANIDALPIHGPTPASSTPSFSEGGV